MTEPDEPERDGPRSIRERIVARVHWLVDLVRGYTWSRHLDPPT